jgi:hypothetical protein
MKSKGIINLLIKYKFSNDGNLCLWSKDHWVVRFDDKDMEIYEEPHLNSNGRYFISEIDYDTLKDALEDIK